MVNPSGAVGDTAPSLTGKSVMITGGGSGIGAALTLGFLSAGATVTFVQNQDGIARAVADEIGGLAIVLRCARRNTN